MICIYKIINIITGDFYLGSTIDFNKRMVQHKNLLKKNEHHSVHLQRAVNKYGIENYIITVIELCNIASLKDREQYYLDELKPAYNTSKSSKCPMLGRKHSDETIVKFKLIPRLKGKESSQYGKKWTPELREKILTSRIGQKRTEEFKETQRVNAKKLDLARFFKGKCNLKVIDDLGNIYDSLANAAKENNVSVQTVCDILKGRHSKTRKGRSFKYYEL